MSMRDAENVYELVFSSNRGKASRLFSQFHFGGQNIICW